MGTNAPYATLLRADEMENAAIESTPFSISCESFKPILVSYYTTVKHVCARKQPIFSKFRKNYQSLLYIFGKMTKLVCIIWMLYRILRPHLDFIAADCYADYAKWYKKQSDIYADNMLPLCQKE